MAACKPQSAVVAKSSRSFSWATAAKAQPATLAAVSITTAAVIRAIVDRSWDDLPVLSTCLINFSASAITAATRPEYDIHAYVIGSAVCSVTLLLAANGYIELGDVIKNLLINRQETITEVMMCVRESLLATAVMQAFRSYAHWQIWTRGMGNPRWQSAPRFIFNWVFLMTVQAALALYARHMRTKALKAATTAATAAAKSVAPDSDELTDSASGYSYKGSTSAGSSVASSQATLPSSPPKPQQLATKGPAKPLANRAGQAGAGRSGGIDAVAEIAPAAGVAAARAAMRVEMGSERVELAVALFERSRTRAYVSPNHTRMRKVRMKLGQMHKNQLPADFEAQVVEQLKPTVPGIGISGIEIQDGCVMVMIDLMWTESMPDLLKTPELPVLALGKALRACQADQHLTDGTSMRAQAGSELTTFAWDTTSQIFVESKAEDPYLIAFLALAQLCRIASVMPVAQCLPAAASTRSQKVQLQLQLTVPSRSRLLGWQPAGSAVSAEAEALSLISDKPQMDVAVLVRHPSGPYMPVTLELLSQNANSPAGTRSARVKAEVDVSCEDAAGLLVELWAKTPAVPESVSSHRYDLLAACGPTLVFPAEQQSAAAELSQYIQSLGGVSASQVLVRAGTAEHTDATAFVADLGAWLSYTNKASADQQADADVAAQMAAVGTSLLVNSVHNGLVEVAQQIVAAMAQGTAGVAAAEAAPWFLAAAQPGADAADAVFPLLCAAMVSGSTDMLEKVLRWGQVYGGRRWRWPWSLTDETGYTALHLAAAQPGTGVCVALINTVKRMLPGEVVAARQAWLTEPGSVGVAPSELFSALNPEHATEHLWEQASGSDAKARAAETSDITAAGSSSAGAAGCSRTAAGSKAVPMDASDAAAATAWPSKAEPVPGFWQLMREAWRWKQGPEYDAWAMRQNSGTVCTWAFLLTLIHTICIYRGYQDGHGWGEARHVIAHGVPYVPMILSFLGFRGFGTWQSWMWTVPLFQCLGYILVAITDPSEMPGFSVSANAGGDHTYMLALVSPFEQNPIPYMVITRALLAACHGWAYDATGFTRPYLQAIALHTAAVLMCTLIRVQQIRSYHAWARTNRIRKRGGSNKGDTTGVSAAMSAVLGAGASASAPYSKRKPE